MLDSLTEAARRALERARDRAAHRGSATVWTSDLWVALADEPESRAAGLIERFGLDLAALRAGLGYPEVPAPTAAGDPLPLDDALRAALMAAVDKARGHDRTRPVGTEHLLLGLLVDEDEAAALGGLGLRARDLAAEIDSAEAVEAGPIPVDAASDPLRTAPQGEAVDLARILDASANRAREGLRVAEDYVRFALDDPGLTRRLKEVRHRLAAAVSGLDQGLLAASRDTPNDVGTRIVTPAERVRESPRAVLAAAFKRSSEALRSLEEYSKLTDVWLAGRFESLRYDVYTLEKLTMTAVAARASLGDASLCLLVGGLPTFGDLTWLVGEALAGGVQMVQLREKALPDREWLARAREVRILTAQARAIFVVNDRPDLARLAGADGVHLGQDDLAPRDARRVMGTAALIGVSTHEPAQVDRAVLDGAGYLGVGPVFASRTKSFDDLAGLGFIRRAAESTGLPWFAIGGIDESNIEDVIEAGARRVAVSSAILRADRPREAAAALRRRLDGAG